MTSAPMRRGEFITLLGGAAAWPLAARAQQAGPVRRIGVLIVGAETDPEYQDRVAGFREALEKLGWAAGRNIRIEYRFAEAPDRLRSFARELVGLSPDVIFANSTPALEALRNETRTVPLVFANVSDLVRAGFVPSLARPGGNITGFSNFEYSIAGKWLEMLKEVAPSTRRVGVLMNQDDLTWTRYFPPIEAAAPSLGISLTKIFIGEAAEFEHALDSYARELNGGLIVFPNPRITLQRERIIAFAARYRLPAIYSGRVFPLAGGLMSYGVNNTDQFRKAAEYVDRILRGEKPGDLPVQLPTKFEFIVNLKTARALGLTLPLPLIGRTDEVIE
jgi:ABC-type uncharacterized transport system substrate-binding protein